jgi:WD40 repeat protein
MLVWLPEGSRIRERFPKEQKSVKWRITCGLAQSWGYCDNILNGHSDVVHSVAFSQDGRRVVSGSFDKTVRIWNVETGEEERKLEGHSHWVYSVAFSQDGRRVVSGSFDKTVRIWNVETGEEERKLEGYASQVKSVAFSQNGKHLVSESIDKLQKILNMEPGKQESLTNSQEQTNSAECLPLASDLITVNQNWIYSSLTGSWCSFPLHQPSTMASNSSALCLGLPNGGIIIVKKQ